MDIITSLLYLFIGVLVGGLAVLMVDTRYLGRRLKDALDAQRDAERKLSALAKKAGGHEPAPVPHEPASILSEEMVEMPEPTQPENLQTSRGRERRLETDDELEAVRDNLTRVSNHVEVLLADKHTLQVESAEAKVRAQTLQEHLDDVRGDNKALQEKNERLSQQLGAAEAEIGYLRRELADLQSVPWTDEVSQDGREQDRFDESAPDTELEELPLVDELFLPEENPPADSQPLETGIDTPASGSMEQMEPEELPSIDDLFSSDDDATGFLTAVPGIEVPVNDTLEQMETEEFPAIDDLFLTDEDLSEALPEEPTIDATADESLEQAETETVIMQFPAETAELPLEGNSQVQEVRGIGPVFAGRLNAAGIHSVADLSTQTPEQLSEIVGLNPSQINKPISWISQAQAASGESNDEGSQSAVDHPLPSIDP